MKKIFVVFLSALYLVLSSGFTQTTHICKEMTPQYHEASTPLPLSGDPCPLCDSDEADMETRSTDCCETEYQIIKVDDSLKNQHNYNLSIKSGAEAIPQKALGTIFDFTVYDTKSESNLSLLTSKVPIQSNPLYIFHCIYRI